MPRFADVPTATTVPPASMNCFSAGTVRSVVNRPSRSRNSSGMLAGSVAPPKPPRPPAWPARGTAPDGRMMTSYLLARLPASIVGG